MAKSQIRKAIEKIANLEGVKAYVDTRDEGVRIKFAYARPFSKEQGDEILKLPFVTKVGYANNYYMYLGINKFYTTPGATVHISKSTKEIKL